MYRALFLSHGDLSVALLKAVELILGEQPAGEVSAFPLQPGQDMEAYTRRVDAFVTASTDQGGAIVFTDLAGGSPFLAAAQVYRRHGGEIPLEVVTGMNLPMAIEVLAARSFSTVKEGRATALAEGQRGVRALSEQLATQSE